MTSLSCLRDNYMLLIRSGNHVNATPVLTSFAQVWRVAYRSVWQADVVLIRPRALSSVTRLPEIQAEFQLIGFMCDKLRRYFRLELSFSIVSFGDDSERRPPSTDFRRISHCF